MLIPLADLIKKYKINPKGVLHVGANTGQEAEDYFKAGIEHTYWIEPIPEIYNQLVKHVSKFDFKSSSFCNALITDVNGEMVDFHIANNDGQSSSLLNFGTHSKEHPTVKFIKTITLETVRIDKIFNDLSSNVENDFNPYDYDFLNIDVQGAELLVLKSMGRYMNNFDFAYIEVNTAHLYKDCPLIEDIDQFFSDYGLERVETKMTGWKWGDAFYIKF